MTAVQLSLESPPAAPAPAPQPPVGMQLSRVLAGVRGEQRTELAQAVLAYVADQAERQFQAAVTTCRNLAVRHRAPRSLLDALVGEMATWTAPTDVTIERVASMPPPQKLYACKRCRVTTAGVVVDQKDSAGRWQRRLNCTACGTYIKFVSAREAQRR